MSIMKEYEGSVYIGVVGPDTEIGPCIDSIYRIQQRPGDSGPHSIRATKGYEARQKHIDNFIDSEHDFILLLDHDMTFPADTLERLRSHKLPYVSGYYMRRTYNPLRPVWFEYGPRNMWPMSPWTEDPQRGILHKLGASGWGCILLHRDVIMAVRDLLKGEPEVIEDDMDVWPYSLDAIMGAIRGLEEATAGDEINADLVRQSTSTLRNEIIPLRAKRDTVGSDVRFPFYAREAGFILWGDPDVRCGHMAQYPIHPDDFTGWRDADRRKLQDFTNEQVAKVRSNWLARRYELEGIDYA